MTKTKLYTLVFYGIESRIVNIIVVRIQQSLSTTRVSNVTTSTLQKKYDIEIATTILATTSFILVIPRDDDDDDTDHHHTGGTMSKQQQQLLSSI
jgi:hypothetical protein